MESKRQSNLLERDFDTDDLRLFSILLDYPDQEGFDRAAFREEINQNEYLRASEPLLKFLNYLDGCTIEELASTYVDTFDFNPHTSIYLTSALPEEERERIFQNLKRVYEEVGLNPLTDELPDFLPLILEFASLAPFEIASGLLLNFEPFLGELMIELKKADNPYAWAIEACQLQIDRYLLVKS